MDQLRTTLARTRHTTVTVDPLQSLSHSLRMALVVVHYQDANWYRGKIG
jgi:hypothetical protein